ncbi:sugar nucleotide-binding protein [Candidatus Daviesbacteria bacterium]|nr:sugar nucleotide-binding protein [Candidatus Daviesbacteria bacterium]
MRYLITGGSGRLGTEFKKYFKGHYPTHKELDITEFTAADWDFIRRKTKFIIHMAGYTDVDKAESEKFLCFKTNVFGTYNLLTRFCDKPFVFISTEHVNCKGVYFQSKLMGELLVKNLAKNYLIIRTLFKPSPWAFEYAFADQMTQGDYVDVIARMIAKKIKQWNGKSEIVYVGTGRKTMFDLAKRTKSDVKPNSVNDLPFKRPKDYLPIL